MTLRGPPHDVTLPHKTFKRKTTPIVYNRSSETFCFFRGFEQLSNSISRQVTTGQVRPQTWLCGIWRVAFLIFCGAQRTTLSKKRHLKILLTPERFKTPSLSSPSISQQPAILVRNSQHSGPAQNKTHDTHINRSL